MSKRREPLDELEEIEPKRPIIRHYRDEPPQGVGFWRHLVAVFWGLLLAQIIGLGLSRIFISGRDLQDIRDVLLSFCFCMALDRGVRATEP